MNKRKVAAALSLAFALSALFGFGVASASPVQGSSVVVLAAGCDDFPDPFCSGH